MKRYVLILGSVLMITLSGCFIVTPVHPGPRGKVIVVHEGHGHGHWHGHGHHHGW